MCMSSCRLPTVPLPHCSTVPRPPLHLSLIMFDCCHCSRTFHGAQAHQRSKSAAPADPKAAALESQPEPEPDPIRSRTRVEAQTKPSSNLALFVVLLLSPHVSVCPSVCFGCVFFLLLFFFGFPFGRLVHSFSLSALFKLYAFKKRLRINWIISFFYYLFSARNS